MWGISETTAATDLNAKELAARPFPDVPLKINEVGYSCLCIHFTQFSLISSHSQTLNLRALRHFVIFSFTVVGDELGTILWRENS